MTSVNFGDLLAAAEDGGFSSTPPGEYDVKVIGADVKKTAAGKDQIVVKFEIVSGPLMGRKTVPRNFVISPESANALAFFFRDMRALGLDSSFFSTNPSLEAVASALVGKFCRVTVGTRVWQNEEREDIKKIAPPLVTQSMPTPTLPTVPSPSAPAVPVVKADTNAPTLPPF